MEHHDAISEIYTSCRFVQSLNAESSMFSILLGMVIDFRLLQPPKLSSPIDVTLLDSVTEVILPQPVKV